MRRLPQIPLRGCGISTHCSQVQETPWSTSWIGCQATKGQCNQKPSTVYLVNTEEQNRGELFFICKTYLGILEKTKEYLFIYYILFCV